MTNPNLLSDLIARVEGATGPDRELDRDIWGALVAVPPAPNTKPLSYIEAPSYTASLDAAVALRTRVAPNWIIARLMEDDHRRWYVEMREGHLTSYNHVVMSSAPRHRNGCANPALALILATLRALANGGKDNGPRDGKEEG